MSSLPQIRKIQLRHADECTAYLRPRLSFRLRPHLVLSIRDRRRVASALQVNFLAQQVYRCRKI
jgi:hypothetical protein